MKDDGLSSVPFGLEDLRAGRGPEAAGHFRKLYPLYSK